MQITAHNIHVTIDNRDILNKVSVDAPSGTSLALTGPSGSGKTTLLNCLGLLLPVTEGRILIDGSDVTKLSVARKRQFWRDNVAFIFQDYGLVPDESVGFNICMESAPILQRKKDWGPRVEEALAKVGLGGRAGDQVAKLSGGERQRVGIARAIHKQARIIFADEPTASLDAANRRMVHELLLGEQERGATVVISTHDDQLAAACNEAVRL
ncbi:MAG: ATP-binding cassette domain-containing protein [Propionibacteriaceae bacterium]|nr:ATP-binding cassette domain-containing protein [Propionibacteriaceae bacterium]